MNRPLEIRDVENISLEASDDKSDTYPQLVAQFACQYETDTACTKMTIDFGSYMDVCCSAIRMINVTHAVVEGISLTMKTPKFTAVVLQQCSHLHIRSVSSTNIQEVDNDSNDFVSKESLEKFGILAYESSDIEMESLEASYFTIGLILYDSSNTILVNVSAAHNEIDGIYLYHSTNISMMNVSAAHNKYNGMDLYDSTETSMMTVSAALNEKNGILLRYSSNTRMMNVSAAHNKYGGMYLYHSTGTRMTNVSAVHNKVNGILLDYSTDTSIMSVSAAHNEYGIFLDYSTGTSMTSVSAAHNEIEGISLHYSTDTSMMNVSAVHNGHNGIYLNHSTDTSMTSVSAAHNKIDGIFLHHTTDTSMMNVSAAYNEIDGILLHYSTETSMMNVSAAYNEIDGIILHYSVDTSMTNVSAVYNENSGISLYRSTNTHILKSVLSEYGRIEMIDTTNTYIINTTSLITAYDTTNIALNDTLFTNMEAPSTASSTSEPTSLPAVITLYGSTLTITNCIFMRNDLSSIKTISSNVTMSGKVLFHNNTASSGTGLIFAKNSLLITTEYSNIQFQNNHAINYGGVFYINAEESYERSVSLQDIIQLKLGGSLITSRTECFVHVEGSRSHARFTFINNTSGRGGDVLYGGLVALGYDGDWNCLLSFKNISDISQQGSLSLISSTPSRVCLCNETGHPDCLTVADPTTHVIYPGQTITIPALVIGEDFGTATGSVFAQFLHTPDTISSIDMDQRQYSIAVEHSQCSNLEYTIFSQSEESAAVLVLTPDSREISHLMNEEDNQEITNTWEILNREPNYKTLAQDIICDFIEFNLNPEFTIRYNESNQSGNRTIKEFYKFTVPYLSHYNHNTDYCKSSSLQAKLLFPKEIYSYPVYINISFRPCPPGFSLSKHPSFRCDCNQMMLQLPGVKCYIQDHIISRSGLVWIAADGNETVAALNCPYNYCNKEEINVTLEDPDSQCNFNHSGTLCGGCQPGLSIALGTNQCLHCPNTHLALLLPFALAGVVLVCFIKVIDLTTSQGTLNGLIFYANVVKANEYLIFNEKQTNPLAVFIAWLNLDLGVETCFFNGLTAYWKTWLQFVFPLYIWSIASIIIILAKYSDKVAKVMGNNSVPVLATLFLLSYAKLFRTIITALSFTILSTTHGSTAVWSADGNLEYLGPKHAPLFAVAAATLLFLWLPYTLLLFLDSGCTDATVVSSLA